MNIHQCCRTGNLTGVQQLLNTDANTIQNIINKKDRVGYTPLHYASMYGYLDIVHELIQSGACVNQRHDWGSTPLHIAVRQGHLDIVKELIGYADLSIKNCDGDTALDVS